MNEKDKEVIYSTEFEEMKRIIEASKKKDKIIEELREELKKQNSNKKHKRNPNEWMEKLRPLHTNFPDEWKQIVINLKKDFCQNRTDVVKRRSYQMALLGIFWTEGVNIPQIGSFRRNKTLESLSETSLQLDLNTSIWDKFDEQDKNEIIDWVNQFRVNPAVKPEALISSNLWGYLLRKIVMCIEKVCESNHNQGSKFQCFPEFKTSAIEAIGKMFFTDFVITPGCEGSPLFFAEIESNCVFELITNKYSSSNEFIIHKDLKKLAVQMSGALLEKVGMIKRFNETVDVDSKLDFSVLKTFGAMICDYKIEFCVCRVKSYDDGKFVMIFESHNREWSFNLLLDDNNEHALTNESQSESFEYNLFNIQMEEEIENNDIELVFEESSEDEVENESSQAPQLPSTGLDFSKQIGSANLGTLKAIAHFIWEVHEYYSNLDGVLKGMHLRPGEFEKDPDLVYPFEVHEKLHTTAGVTPQSLQNELYINSKSSPLSDMYSYEEFNVPIRYIHAALPVILLVKISEEDASKQNVRYMEGMSIPELEKFIEQQPADEMESDRVYYRSVLILDIVMAIYMASKSGIAFEQFTVDEITFRNGIYCIKTYSQATPISNDFTVLDSVASFRSFYREIFFIDGIMMENEPKYENLNRIEKIVFSRIRKFKRTTGTMSDEEWLKLFTDAKAEFEKILNDRCCFSRNDTTWILLEDLLTLIKNSESRETDIGPMRKNTLASSPHDQSSSVETIPINEKNDPVAKISEIAIVETEQSAEEERLAIV